MVVTEVESIDLDLNLSKCEIMTQNNTAHGTVPTSLPGPQVVNPAHNTLLSSLLGDGECVAKAIGEKTAALKRVGEKFMVLSAHDAFILL